MGTNTTGNYQPSDVEQFIADELLPVAQRTLVIYQMGDPADLPEGRGLTYTFTRFNRFPLPFAPAAEGVPPVGQPLSISQVTATMQQWADACRITDLAELSTKHPLMKTANQLLGIQVGETFERNCFNSLLGGVQVNYVNSRGSRAALVAGDVLDIHTVNRTVAALNTLGAYKFNGPEQTDVKKSARDQASKAYKSPESAPHFAGINHTLVSGDWRENPTVQLAAIYSRDNYLYNSEVGWWAGVRFCESNMVPFWLGVAAVQGTAIPTGGSFTAGNWFVQVTGQDTQNQYETNICQVSNSITVAANGSISVTVPSTSGFTYSVYVGTSASPVNLALSSSGPTSGPLQGQATQIPAGTTVIITGAGIAQVPPAAPTTGVTVYPTWILGKGYFANVKLKDVEVYWLDKPDKLDIANQLRVISWKATWGECIKNQFFGARIESASTATVTFG